EDFIKLGGLIGDWKNDVRKGYIVIPGADSDSKIASNSHVSSSAGTAEETLPERLTAQRVRRPVKSQTPQRNNQIPIEKANSAAAGHASPFRTKSRPFRKGELIELRWDGVDGWWAAEIVGRCRNNNSIKDSHGIPVPRESRWDIKDLTTGQPYAKQLDESNYESAWRYHNVERTSEAVTSNNLLLRAVSTLLTISMLPPGPSGLIHGDYPILRKKWTGGDKNPDSVRWERATTTRDYGLYGGTAKMLKDELSKGRIQFDRSRAAPTTIFPITANELKTALAQGARVEAINPDLPGLTEEQVRYRTKARAFCAEAGELLFSTIEGSPESVFQNDQYLENVYASHVLGRNGLLGEDEDCLDHLLGCSTDPNDDHFALEIDSLDPSTYDSIHLQYISADDFEYKPELIKELKEYEKPEEKAEMTKAIVKEVSGLCDRGTFAVDLLPPDRKTVDSKLVLKVKYKADGTLDKFKARLVARGFLARAGLDFYTTKAPMALISTARLLISIGVHHDLDIVHMDIPQAFIQAFLDREIWMDLPAGINLKPEFLKRIEAEHPNSKIAIKLIKSIYGLKQASAVWNNTLNAFLVEQCGFTRATFDPCFYSSHTSNGWVCISVSTDDMLITGTDKGKIAELREKANKRFGEGQWTPSVDSFLGVNCHHDRAAGTFSMDVASKIVQLLQDYDLTDLHPSDVPYSSELEQV
ncbi:MAG: reverse transcriptase domain-containing protein, partial [Bacteroidota bacterium]